MPKNGKHNKDNRKPPHIYKLTISDKISHLAELQQLGIHELRLIKCCKIFTKTFGNL